MVHIAQTNNMQRTRRQSKLKVAAWLKSAVDFVTTEPAVDIVAEPAVDLVTTEPAVDIVTTEPAVDIVAEPAVDIVTTEPAVDLVTTEPAVDIVAEPAVDIVTTASRSHLSLNPETGILEYHFADSDSDCGSHVSGTTNGSVVSEIFPVSHLYYHLYMQYLNSLSIMWSGV